MTEIHEDYGSSYPYSDHKRGDHIAYRLEGHTERGEDIVRGCGPDDTHQWPDYAAALCGRSGSWRLPWIWFILQMMW